LINASHLLAVAGSAGSWRLLGAALDSSIGWQR
jgi:hypothetical protein